MAKQIDIAEHALLSLTLVRLAQRIGTNRVAKEGVADSRRLLARSIRL